MIGMKVGVVVNLVVHAVWKRKIDVIGMVAEDDRVAILCGVVEAAVAEMIIAIDSMEEVAEAMIIVLMTGMKTKRTPVCD